MKARIITALIIFTIMISSASAQTRSDARQKSQRVRIHEGRKDGEVTNGEAALLNKQQRHIRRSERRAKADGDVTAREKVRLERKQDRANRNIRRAKHNDIEKKD
jgi:hypothetical protein